jgi:hypothetical protein
VSEAFLLYQRQRRLVGRRRSPPDRHGDAGERHAAGEPPLQAPLLLLRLRLRRPLLGEGPPRHGLPLLPRVALRRRPAVAGRADADDPVWSPREELRQCADLSPSPPTSRFFFPLDLSVRVMVSPKLQLPKVLSVEDKLRNLGCIGIGRKIAEAEMDLTKAKSEGYLWGNGTATGSSDKKKLLAVIGVYTGFGSRLKRNTFRGSWMPRGDALKKLEEKGVVIRFVIGRRFYSGSISLICSISSTLDNHSPHIILRLFFMFSFPTEIVLFGPSVQIEVIAWTATSMMKIVGRKIS